MNKSEVEMSVPNWMYKKPIAHRGYFNETAPENSIKAFQNAINRDFAIEMDVQLLKDGTLIVFHDNHLKRMTGLDKFLDEVNYEDIKHLKLLSTDEKIPTFKEFLEYIDGQIPLVIEFKNESKGNLLEEKAYQLLQSYKGDFTVQSFNPLSVYWFKKHAPHIVRGQLSYDYKNKKISRIGKWFLRNVYSKRVTKPHYVMYDIKSLESQVIKRLKTHNIPLFSYTAKNMEDYKYAKSLSIPACFEGFDPE